jgi:hypothetical protein
MDKKEQEEVKTGLATRRDELQKTMSEARHQRATLQLANIDKYRDFLQKLGELSFVFGAAIVPLIIVSNPDKVNHLGFVVVGVGLYLINGLLALWRSKQILERNADDAPYIGLEEELYTYPIINVHNKLILELENKDFQEEYVKTNLEFLNWATQDTPESQPKVSLWLDGLLINFVIASLFIVKAAWIYPTKLYWVVFFVIAASMVGLTVYGYIKSKQSQTRLETKRKKLAAIKSDYQKWHNKTILGEENLAQLK